jgi:nucleotide-binding universal stress UspA family protein
MKILLATDGSVHSKAATEFCRKVIGDPGSVSLKIISAVNYPAPVPADPGGLSTEYFVQLETEERARANRNVDEAQGQIRDLFFNDAMPEVTTEVIDGSPSRVIVEAADSWGADLIVLGSHGYGFWDRVLLGSVSDSVIHHAHCSVLTVRTPKGPDGEERKE